MEDRLALIRAAAEKTTFKRKLQTKSKKLVRNRRAAKKSVDDTDSFDESSMYDDDKAVRKIFEDSGVVDTFNYTTKLDNVWN
jgi:archaellum biogenesis ATPase FlaH